MTILAISGDIGGQKALIPVLERMLEKNIDFTVIEHRGLEKHSEKWKSVVIDSEDEESWADSLKKLNADLLLFSTSVKDTFPLKMAKKAQKSGLKVFCLLDNWMNYRKRLELNGELFLPDKYLLMDKIAYDEALKDDLPESILKITGQPALRDIQKAYSEITEKKKKQRLEELGIENGGKLIVFISEPAELDQGKYFSSSDFRGYTEKTVLISLCKELQKFSDQIQFALVPHPRENIENLLNVWQKHAGKLQGGIFGFKNGREAVMMADGVAGMASILLHEAWLINTPTISLQPDVTREDLLILTRREEVISLINEYDFSSKISEWMQMIFNHKNNTIRKELCFHQNAADNIISLIEREL